MKGSSETMNQQSTIRYVVAVLAFLSVMTVPGLATDTNLGVPYYQQENDYYCGPAVAQMWTDYHSSLVSQNTLYSFITNHNIETGWATDPQGLEDCVENYVPNLIADDHKWSSADSAILGQAVDIVNRGIPSASLINGGDHWNLIKGVSYSLYGGEIYQVNGVWVQDPWYTMSANIYYAINSWKNEFTRVDVPSSSWDNYWVTDLAGFAREQMNMQNLFTEELKGSSPGKPVLVHSLDKHYPDYYLIPFEKNGVPVVVSLITVKDNIVAFGAGAALEKVTSVIMPDFEDAKQALPDNGSGDQWKARLVWKPCEQTMSQFMPVWEFTSAAGKTKYVGYDQFAQKGRVYDELTERKLKG
jgi:hypothetical protein